jgi:hypothetical protein
MCHYQISMAIAVAVPFVVRTFIIYNVQYCLWLAVALKSLPVSISFRKNWLPLLQTRLSALSAQTLHGAVPVKVVGRMLGCMWSPLQFVPVWASIIYNLYFMNHIYIAFTYKRTSRIKTMTTLAPAPRRCRLHQPYASSTSFKMGLVR